MQRLDRRRALLSAEGGSGWEVSFYASNGALPPEGKMAFAIARPAVSGQSTGSFVNGYYRLTGITTDGNGGGGAALRVNSAYFGLKSEAECAFYIRKFSGNDLSLQMNLRSTSGNTLMVRVQKTGISVFREVESVLDKDMYSRTMSLNVRYVLRCVFSGTGNRGYVYLNNELIATKTSTFVRTSDNCPSQIVSVSTGHSRDAIVDVEYYKYRRL